MSTLSIPLTKELEDFIKMEVKMGKFDNKAAVVRRALKLLAEEEAINAVLQSQKEAMEGKLLSGNIKEVASKFTSL